MTQMCLLLYVVLVFFPFSFKYWSYTSNFDYHILWRCSPLAMSVWEPKCLCVCMSVSLSRPGDLSASFHWIGSLSWVLILAHLSHRFLGLVSWLYLTTLRYCGHACWSFLVGIWMLYFVSLYFIREHLSSVCLDLVMVFSVISWFCFWLVVTFLFLTFYLFFFWESWFSWWVFFLSWWFSHPR